MTEKGPPGRDIPGALNGSRFVEQPHIQAEVRSSLAFLQEQSKVLVEIGFDHGRRLHSTALLNPSWQVLGLEVRKQRVLEANERAERDGLGNLKAWRFDARTVFANVLLSHSVDVVEALFPTPWWHPGLRQKRLLVDQGFLADVRRVLKPGGLFYTATDVPEYGDLIHRELASAPGLAVVDVERGSALRPECAQLSRREWRCEQDGIPWRRFCALAIESTIRRL